MFKQLEEALGKVDFLKNALDNEKANNKEKDKEIKKMQREYEKKIREMQKEHEKEINELNEKNEKLQSENNRLKAQKEKDSSNSSKPSSTNGYKRVIINRREKSKRKKGGQKKHKGKSLGKKELDKLKERADVIKNPTVEVNKNDQNKNKKPYIVTEIDIQVITTLTEYRYYPDENGKYNIPLGRHKHICYGNHLKALAMILMYESYNSTDATQNIIKSLTNNDIKLSKGTLYNWTEEISQKLEPEVEHIEEELLNNYFAHCDESMIKVNGDNWNEVCASTKTHTRMWQMKSKKHEELEKINFFDLYVGIIVKDGTNIYNGFGMGFSQCISHIQRYLKGVYDFIDHSGAKKMSEFLTKYNNYRSELIERGVTKFGQKEYDKIINEYNEIIKEWKKEWQATTPKNNTVYDEERKLLMRLEEDDKEQILYFLKDFKVPATNNQVESDQRPIKIKQKIGKFRSEIGAEYYTIIRSCISTYKKQSICVYDALIKAFESKAVIA